MRWCQKSLCVAILAVAMPVLARADFLFGFQSVTFTGSDYLWTYDLMLNGTNSLRASVPGGPPFLPNDTSVFYDVQGYETGTAAFTPNGSLGSNTFTLSEQNSGPIPPF